MSGTVADRKRLLKVTAGNIRNNHIYINGHYDFFPTDCIGRSKKSRDGSGKPISIELEGLGTTIETDIGSDSRTGKPRRMFRGRKWVREFFERHDIGIGDVLALEKVGSRKYRLSRFDTKTDRDDDWHKLTSRPLPGRGPTVLDLFAGCGGSALGFKRARFRTVLAVEWDAAACDTLRASLTDPKAARLQGFADDFVFCGERKPSWRYDWQLGSAW